MVRNGQKRKAPFQLCREGCENKKCHRIIATRSFTLLGKITFIKSLLVSQFIYILTPLPTYVEAL